MGEIAIGRTIWLDILAAGLCLLLGATMSFAEEITPSHFDSASQRQSAGPEFRTHDEVPLVTTGDTLLSRLNTKISRVTVPLLQTVSTTSRTIMVLSAGIESGVTKAPSPMLKMSITW